MAIFRNLTPHTVNLCDAEGNKIRAFESEGVARAAQTTVELGEIDGIRLVKPSFGEPVGLPEAQEGVFLIVSLATANAAREYGRTTEDLLLVADTVRDETGKICGCRAFSRL